MIFCQRNVGTLVNSKFTKDRNAESIYYDTKDLKALFSKYISNFKIFYLNCRRIDKLFDAFKRNSHSS